TVNPSPGKRGRVRYVWWRAHHGLPGHAKWRAVARAAQVPVSTAFHIVVCLLDAASRGHPRGSIEDFKPFDCAGIVDVSHDKVDRVVEVLREIHWIEGNMIAEWDDRQPQREDNGAANRASAYRSRNESVTNTFVTHRKRDGPGSSRNESVTTPAVTPANAPERDKDLNIFSSENSAARARAEIPNQKNEPAGSLATALCGALARQPITGQATEAKPPSAMSRAELAALYDGRRATGGDHQ
ncbi:MAG TPA: hypothetical protein VGJ26_01550, partial [Pirellulales bacterium]